MTDSIKKISTDYADEAMLTFRQMQTQYWAMHKELLETEFSTHWETVEAMAKLGQFAIAIKAQGKAYTAMSTTRCND